MLGQVFSMLFINLSGHIVMRSYAILSLSTLIKIEYNTLN